MSNEGFIVRPFCSEPWTDDMIRVLDISCSEGCETCGNGERLIYRKEFS